MPVYDDYSSWKNWDPNRFGCFTSKESKRFHLELKSLKLKPTDHILEIGFGHGHFMGWAKSRNYKIDGIEKNSHLVEIAIQNGFSATSTSGEGYGHEKYNLIAAWDVLEHMSHDEIEAALSNVRDALVVGGYFIAKFPNGDSPLGLMHQNGDITHRTSIGYHKWTFFAQQAKMKIVAIRGTRKVIFYPNPFVTLIKSTHWIIQKIAQWIYRQLFLPHYKNDYFSADTVVILRKN